MLYNTAYNWIYLYENYSPAAPKVTTALGHELSEWRPQGERRLLEIADIKKPSLMPGPYFGQVPSSVISRNRLSLKAKSATRTDLARVTVFAIGLKVGWIKPYWAGWAVAMVSLASGGQPMSKGALRLAGTAMGCVMARIILSLAPQNRWLFD